MDLWRAAVALAVMAALVMLAGVLNEQRKQTCYAGAAAWQSYVAHRDAGDYQYLADAIGGTSTTPKSLDRAGAELIASKVRPTC